MIKGSKPNIFDLQKPSELLDPRFKKIVEYEDPLPVKKMLEIAFDSIDDPDGNFLEQFQTTAFDARYFELYLDQYFKSAGFKVSRDFPQPDFFIEKDGIRVGVEATTANPSDSRPDPLAGLDAGSITQDMIEFMRDEEVPIRVGSPLFSKLQKRYWEKPHCKGLPLVIAIELFFSDYSLSFTDNPIAQFVFGKRHFAEFTADGIPIIKQDEIESHTSGSKSIPSGFFDQPDVENISAVLFTNSGTHAKFQRMGYQAGLDTDGVSITRFGTAYNPDPEAMDPTYFSYNMDRPPYKEKWGQGVSVMMNPNAKYPIPKDFFPDGSQTYLEDGVVMTDSFGVQVLQSKTLVILSEGAIKVSDHLSSYEVFAVGNERFDLVTKTQRAVRSPDGIEEHGWYFESSGYFGGIVTRDPANDIWGFVVYQSKPAGCEEIYRTDAAGTREETVKSLQKSLARLTQDFYKKQRKKSEKLQDQSASTTDD